MTEDTRVIPILVIKGADKAIEQYKKAFGATETYPPAKTASGAIMHASLNIGDSQIYLTEENSMQGTVASPNQGFCIYLPDVDAAMKKAVGAGLKEERKAEDMFWGDRMGTVKDPFGIKWMLATHVRDVPPEEIERHMKTQH